MDSKNTISTTTQMDSREMSRAVAHILVLPFPAQGHVNPLMHFCRLICSHGIRITFVNTEFNHKKVISAMKGGVTTTSRSSVSLVSVPDGLDDDDERNNFGKLCDSMLTTMPQKIEELVNTFLGDDAITCIVADANMAWVRKIGEKLGIEVAVIWPASLAFFYIYSCIDSMIRDGLIDCNGCSTKKRVIQVSTCMPSIDTSNLPWSIGDLESTKSVFKYIKTFIEEIQLIEWKLCNSTPELEPGAFSLLSKFLPIGPLMANYDTRSSGVQFWQEDWTYSEWLDQQQPNSVIYVAFGSITIFSETQFQEIALGLELTNKPYLWVVRPGLTNGIRSEIRTRQGKIVGWVSQQNVLKHPAIACFVSHCGWNSTIEGVRHGVPFLCLPYFADQFLNKDYICDLWKVGLGLQKDEIGIVRKEEVKQKVEKLFGDETIKARSLRLKKLVGESIEESGESSKNLNNFINWLKK